MKIYYTRHGQTAWNATNRVCGISDVPLDEKGTSQARALADKVLEAGDIDMVISSPLARAIETARIVCEKAGIPMSVDDRLAEWDYGKYEGVDRNGSWGEGKPAFQEAKLQFGVRMGETGESLLQLAHRVYCALDDFKERHEGNNILLLSHGGVCRVIETYFENMTIEGFCGYFIGNCELRCQEL